jgi:hypothetical protein
MGGEWHWETIDWWKWGVLLASILMGLLDTEDAWRSIKYIIINSLISNITAPEEL